ncbi:MAG: hypothetical protein RLZZ511_1762 [Cyanobacteriota bacterium]|jgi:Uma2 family endonuclease
MTTTDLSQLTTSPATIKRWTVTDYHRMSELGILRPHERTELIAGQVLSMAAKGTPHVLSLRLLALFLDTQFADQPYFVSTQDPIQLDNSSEPEPDCAIVRGNALDYVASHPTPDDVLLVIEVADSTLKYDTEVKDKLYAQSGIADYWVLDLQNRQFHIFRNRTPTGYTSGLILNEPNQISPIAFPQINLNLTDLLPPF